MIRRAESLAARIEQGAAGLATFAEGLSDAEWGTPTSPTDRRTVGQIVNHVALVYPIEVDLARAIASGNAVTDVTWQVVAEMNAGHAREHAKVTKAEALELLRTNSRQAADRVRAFNDEELDSGGAVLFELRCSGDRAVRGGGPRRSAQLAPPCAHPHCRRALTSSADSLTTRPYRHEPAQTPTPSRRREHGRGGVGRGRHQG